MVSSVNTKRHHAWYYLHGFPLVHRLPGPTLSWVLDPVSSSGSSSRHHAAMHNGCGTERNNGLNTVEHQCLLSVSIHTLDLSILLYPSTANVDSLGQVFPSVNIATGLEAWTWTGLLEETPHRRPHSETHLSLGTRACAHTQSASLTYTSDRPPRKTHFCADWSPEHCTLCRACALLPILLQVTSRSDSTVAVGGLLHWTTLGNPHVQIVPQSLNLSNTSTSAPHPCVLFLSSSPRRSSPRWSRSHPQRLLSFLSTFTQHSVCNVLVSSIASFANVLFRSFA